MYKRSILRGYDKVTEKVIADVLHIPLNKAKKKHKTKGAHRMKIPMKALKEDAKDKKSKGKGKAKLSSLKKKNDKDGDE